MHRPSDPPTDRPTLYQTKGRSILIFLHKTYIYITQTDDRTFVITITTQKRRVKYRHV